MPTTVSLRTPCHVCINLRRRSDSREARSPKTIIRWMAIERRISNLVTRYFTMKPRSIAKCSEHAGHEALAWGLECCESQTKVDRSRALPLHTRSGLRTIQIRCTSSTEWASTFSVREAKRIITSTNAIRVMILWFNLAYQHTDSDTTRRPYHRIHKGYISLFYISFHSLLIR